ncbi:CU044_5270 family protein [Nonomuraea rhodomycinica]|uniref:CU044_5270 family protein n=1 Tax=Nonomuraea rhodomycinica TaxID=1712872 RepID=A0A7Y6ITT2_9ACTN|nr:CU044_5270 family protein [Nonomuraea rhodomycinica]NUW44025.1 CU044_5270 family protein [Nonomuraea rhodomycinica]
MDELELVRDLYGEPPRPDPAARARVRARLERRRTRRWRVLPWAARQERRPSRPSSQRRRLSWGGALAGAAAALAAVVVAFGASGALGGPPAPVRIDAAATGRAVLLAAATTAASEPPARGAYWRVTRQTGAEVTTLWAARDGRAWISGPGAGSGVRPVARPFTMAGRPLSVAEIEGLPADAGALRRRVVALLPPGSGDGVLADAVSGLLWSKPSPPAVRAAAYRLLADLPNVRYLGRSADPKGRPGEAFAFTLDPATGVRRTLVLDPASSQVLSSSDSPGTGDGRETRIVLAAGWTDEGPSSG